VSREIFKKLNFMEIREFFNSVDDVHNEVLSIENGKNLPAGDIKIFLLVFLKELEKYKNEILEELSKISK
jgi:hypothetical protein